MQALDTMFSSNQFNFNNIIKEISSDISQNRLPSSSTNGSHISQLNFKQFANRSEPELLQSHSNIMYSSAYPNTLQNPLNHPEDFIISHEDENKDLDLIGGNNQSPDSVTLSRGSKKITKLLRDNSETIILKEEKCKGKKRPWQPAEDAKVLELLGNYGQSWALIAAALGNRTGKQVRDRYLNYLRPDIKDEDFNVQEDRLLLALYYQLGAKWSRIASHIPGRTECQVKNRFYAHIKKRLMFPDFNAKNMAKANNIEAIYLDDNENGLKEEVALKLGEKKEEFYANHELSQCSLEDQTYSVIPGILDSLHQQSQNGNGGNVEQNVQMQGNMQGQNFVNNQMVNPVEGLSNLIEPFNQANKSHMNTNINQNEEQKQNEQVHAHALLSLESEFTNRDKLKRYEELVRRKNALEFFYTKTIQEMNSLGIVGFGVPNMM